LKSPWAFTGPLTAIEVNKNDNITTTLKHLIFDPHERRQLEWAGEAETAARRGGVYFIPLRNDDGVPDVMLLLYLANLRDGSLEVARLMLERLRLDDQFARVIRHHPLGSMLGRINTDDGEWITTDFGNPRRDHAVWLLQMLSISRSRFRLTPTSTTSEFTGHGTTPYWGRNRILNSPHGNPICPSSMKEESFLFLNCHT
jgi:hypothetical protein